MGVADPLDGGPISEQPHHGCFHNTAPQGQFIRKTAAARGLPNVDIVTADMNHFTTAGRFDRVVSVEMFEHMRN